MSIGNSIVREVVTMLGMYKLQVHQKSTQDLFFNTMYRKYLFTSEHDTKSTSQHVHFLLGENIE